jgi:RNA polymerase sigma-70 factor (ECF subfamily)
MEVTLDDQLIQQSKAGDVAAFKELVQRHEGKVAGVVKSMLGSTPEAEDVGQEVFIKFYESLDKFRGDSMVSTYLVRIAINLSLNELKKRKRRDTRYLGLDEGRDAKANEESMDLKELLVYELNQLDPEFKAVVTLRLVEGYSTEETSNLLKIPLGTVLSRLSRAQIKLRLALSKKLKP